MDFTLASGEIVILVIALIAAGVATGFLAGLLGIGGGGVLVPVLYETFTALDVPDQIRMHMVLGTSFAVIVPTAWRSFRAHLAKGAVDSDLLARLGPFVVAGVGAGILLVSSASGNILKLVWIVCGAILALKLAIGRDDWRLGSDLPRSYLAEVIAFLIGVVSTLMSIGGGMFFVAFFTLYGRPILRAVATSSGFGPMIALPGVAGYIWAGWGAPDLPAFSIGYVSLLGALLIIPASVIVAPLGVRAAHGLSKRGLELAFAVFLGLVALRLALSLL
jgi:uncharacterized protein